MSYLDDSQYLGTTPQVPMQLPDELAQQLAGYLGADPGANIVLPPDMIRLPGGIIMKKTTALVLGIAIVLALVYWYTSKKKKKK